MDWPLDVGPHFDSDREAPDCTTPYVHAPRTLAVVGRDPREASYDGPSGGVEKPVVNTGEERKG